MTHISSPKKNYEFNTIFQEEQNSIEYLFSKRWPNGFTCPYCERLNKKLAPAKNMTCSNCGHPTSITTNTIMHGTKKPLSQWLTCIWWLSSSQEGKSARDLQRVLKLSSYQTAWTWLQKLRLAMAMADKKKCSRMVEVASTSISSTGGNIASTALLTSTEIISPTGLTGRIKIAVVSSVNCETLKTFLTKSIKTGSSLLVPEEEPFHSIDKNRYTIISGSDMNRTQKITNRFEKWINEVHHGGVASKHLQLYLDEFCFHRNSTMLPDQAAKFNLLLSGVLNRKTLSYKNITSQDAKE